MKRALFIFLLAVSVVSASAALAAKQSGEPTARVKGALDKMIVILDSGSSWDEKKVEIKAEVMKIFDFRELAKRSLGRPWNDMSPAQRDEFTELFKELLEKTYLGAITEYNQERVEYLSERVKDDKAMVMTKILSDQETLVNYRLIKKDEWMVYDVIAENVSLVKNYREQFHSITQGQPADKVGDLLISTMKSKIKQLEEKRAQESAS